MTKKRSICPPMMHSNAIYMNTTSLPNDVQKSKLLLEQAFVAMEKTIVLYPSPLIGHLVSMVELGKLILSRDPSFSVTVLISSAPSNTGSTAPYITQVSATTPSIAFRHLPAVSLPPNSSTAVENLGYEIPRLNNPNVESALQTISQNSSLKAFIIDFFCTAAIEVSSNLGIPTFFFYTSGASALCEFLYLPTLHEIITDSFEDLNVYLEIPGIPPLHVSDLPKPLLKRNTKIYNNFLYTANQMAKSSGIIVNSFEAIEPKAVKALNLGLCTPNSPNPPVYCIGPLIASNRGVQGHDCLTWLNSMPSKSVLFLCFGSLGTFKTEQLKEIATGLEKIGHSFLWVVKNPPADDDSKQFSPPPEVDLDALLPEGFLERTKDRGLVVKSWAPQLAILNHDAVGGFVTHCGWNSVLEAVCGGVPMIAWPLYAEQRMNRVFMVEEMKVALPLGESEGGFVAAAELEKRVKELMDGERGKAVRERVTAMRDEAEAALGVGGSSHLALAKLLDIWK